MRNITCEEMATMMATYRNSSNFARMSVNGDMPTGNDLITEIGYEESSSDLAWKDYKTFIINFVTMLGESKKAKVEISMYKSSTCVMC